MNIFETNLPVLNKNIYLIDTHCHLDMGSYNVDLSEVITRAASNGIRRIVTIGIDLPSSKRAVTLAREFDQISATIGIHPHDVDSIDDTTYKELKQLFTKHSSQIVGYGEIGLDYVKNHTPADMQQLHFSRQLALAHDLDLPIIVHNRGADDDTLRLLKKAKPFTKGGVMHCFSSDYEFATKVLDLGLLISIPGIVTFKNAILLQDVVRKIPVTSLILETDGPFLAPHPYRGKRNEPVLLLHTANQVAKIKQISISEVAHQTTKNAEELFHFDKGKKNNDL